MQIKHAKQKNLYRKTLEITMAQWLNMLKDSSVFKSEDIKLMNTLYSCNASRETATKLAKMMGVYSHSVLNLQIGRLGKRIIKTYSQIAYPLREKSTIQYWHILFWGEDAEKKGQFYWQLRPELKEACDSLLNDENQLLMSAENSFFLGQELSSENIEDLFEGAKKQITVNAYERNIRARQICLNKYGYKCCVCDFDFEEYYGEIGERFIEVHHLKPLSEIQSEYKVDPINDFRPICPNCHAMVHRANLSIEELIKIVKKEM